MIMPQRSTSSGSYRYGFNGKENDSEVKGTGNQQDYGERIYDTRLARFLSTDPLTKSYPMLTPYQYASNSPIWMIDLDGLEGIKFSSVWHGRATLPQFIQNPDIYGTAVESAASLNRTINPVFSIYNYGIKLMTGTNDYDGNPIDSRGRAGVVTDMGVETMQWMTGARFFKALPNASTPLEQQMAQNARATGTPPAKQVQTQAMAQDAKSSVSTTSKPSMQPQLVQQAQAKSRGITPNSTNYREVFFNENPSLRGKVWVHHAVEKNNVQKFYPGIFTEVELNSIGNLRGISNSINPDLHLSKIRIEWNNFYRTHPTATTTKQQILNKAAEIDLKYGNQFTPPK